MQNESGLAKRLSFESELLGRRQPWIVRHRRLEYAGEVIVADALQPEWGLPLQGGLSFRVVFFTAPRRIPAARILDRRIAMAVPRRSPDQSEESLHREMLSIREARERYSAGRDADNGALRQFMEEREESLRSEFGRRLAASYVQGRVYTHEGAAIDPRAIFEADAPELWAERLASEILSRAYPVLPFDEAALPDDILNSECIAALYRGLFQGDSDAQELVRAFGPGLGLTRRDGPGAFDASQCQASAIIRGALEAAGGEMQAQDVLTRLTDEVGLTRPLAALYLMAFVRQERSEIELVAGHKARCRRGKPFPGVRVTWDLISEIAFDDSLADQLAFVRLQPSESWDAALLYASLLVPGLTLSTDPKNIVAQEQRLVGALNSMSAEGRRVRLSLEALNPSPQAIEVMESLGRLGSVSGYAEFYSQAQDIFGGPDGLRLALETYDRLKQLASRASEIVRAKAYLSGMAFGREHQDTALERDSIAAMIDFDSLAAAPPLWEGVAASFQRLRTRFTNAYISHHARYQLDALELRHKLERLAPQVDALVRFSQMPELGDPVGVEVPDLFKGVSSSLKVCHVVEDDLRLDDAPYCQTCLLQLNEQAPRREAELLVGATDRAMRDYNRRLSSFSARLVITHPTREQIDKFISLVNVADPSALVNVLDDEVLEFLRRFLRNS